MIRVEDQSRRRFCAGSWNVDRPLGLTVGPKCLDDGSRLHTRDVDPGGGVPGVPVFVESHPVARSQCDRRESGWKTYFPPIRGTRWDVIGVLAVGVIEVGPGK